MATLMDYFNNSRGWIYFLAPLILGVLHGIEPRHSRIENPLAGEAAEGLFWQRVLLGVSAAVSHTLMIWIIASAASHFRSHWTLGNAQPYLEFASAFVTLGLAVRSFMKLQAHEQQRSVPLAAQALSKDTPSASHVMVAGAAIGMLPCPLTLGVLLTCLQSGRLMLGMTLAVCFGMGLALSMATAGSVSVWFTRKARQWHLDINGLRHRISFIFCILLALLAVVIAWKATINFLNS